MRKNVSRLIGAKKKHEYGETSNSNTYCEDEFISPIVLATLYALPFQKKTFIIKIVVVPVFSSRSSRAWTGIA